MTINEIKKLPLHEIQDIYCAYLVTQKLSSNTINTSRNDAFYLYKNDKTIDFWELLLNPNFEKLAYDHLYLTLSKLSKGNVNSNINGYMSHIRKFRQFAISNTDIEVPKKKPKITTENSKTSYKNMNSSIPIPTCDEVEKYLMLWDKLDNYRLQENALDKLFFELVPANKNISDILLKAATLNDFYSTNIFSIFPVAQHILTLDIDKRIKSGDETLVNDIIG